MKGEILSIETVEKIASLEKRIKDLEQINEEHRKINGELRKTNNEAIKYASETRDILDCYHNGEWIKMVDILYGYEIEDDD